MFAGFVVVFITFGLILLADKYRYRPPASVPTRRLSEPPRTTNPVFIARANSGMARRALATLHLMSVSL